MTPLTKAEREQVSEILNRRAQEIAVYSDDYRREPSHYGSVEFALTREIERLRRLAIRVNPPKPQEDDEQ